MSERIIKQTRKRLFVLKNRSNINLNIISVMVLPHIENNSNVIHIYTFNLVMYLHSILYYFNVMGLREHRYKNIFFKNQTSYI